MTQTPSIGKILANFVLNDLKGMLAARRLTIQQCPIAPRAIGYLAAAVASGLLTKAQMKRLAAAWMEDALEPAK